MKTMQQLRSIAVALTRDAVEAEELVQQLVTYVVAQPPPPGRAKDVEHDLLVPFRQLLPPRQHDALRLLLAGCGVREAGRRLGISHVAVLGHREKILRTLRRFLSAPPTPAAPLGPSPP